VLLLSEELSELMYEDDEEACELESDEELDVCEALLLSDELCELDEDSKLEELDSELVVLEVLLLSDELWELEEDKELDCEELDELEL
jgi:hypothetical protein